MKIKNPRFAQPENSLKLEVHEHSILGSAHYDKSGKWVTKITHSHAGGAIPHQHLNAGPASYTIDKDEWARVTGMKGGGRKKFTTKPSGEQFQWIPLTEEQSSFELIVCDPTPESMGQGPGVSLPARMMLTFGMNCEVKQG